MPARFFLCPDNKETPIADCLKSCRLNSRCLSLPTLHSIGNVREWRGQPSTTQCLNPTRMEYLQVKCDFTIDPFDHAFSLLGTRHHGMLESVAKKLEGLQAEKKLSGEVTGILDLIEPINGGDSYRLIDYKTYGSYVAAKHLGLVNGESDVRKLALQMNNYRVMVQDLGFNVTELKVQITVRDGNTMASRMNKVDKNIYLLPVEILPDDEVREYFIGKSFALCNAISKNELPEYCGYEDSWANRRCRGYCSVCAWCPEGADLNRIPLREVK